MKDTINIKGAREHNLKDVDVEFPRNKMTVFTGVSGSGKSSLAFDTIFAEGQRRYVESLSSYARQFLDNLDKPDVDEISGLSPAISIDQKSHSSNPRSTVATITDIYDYLRVLYARAGTAYCPVCGDKIQQMSVDEIVDAGIEFAGKRKEGKSMVILAPVVRGRKGEYYQLLYDLLNEGFSEARIDGEFRSIRDRIDLDRYKQHTIEVVTDRIRYGVDFDDKDNKLRLSEAVEAAVKKGNGAVVFVSGDQELLLSAEFACPKDNFAFPEIEPRLFSFNSPYGACEACHGLGIESKGSDELCEECDGMRLKPAALSVLLEGENITEVTEKTIEDAYEFFKKMSNKLDKEHGEIIEAPVREIISRLKFLLDVGLDYLTLDRKAGTLSGGEAQRIRLASQIGSQLTGALYVLDEPTIGLHPRDNDRLIQTLKDLRDLGNTIVVVEHDEQTIRESDYLVDIGPGPGVHGGKIVVDGEIPEILEEDKKSLTLDYLKGKREVPVPNQRRGVTKQHDFLRLRDVEAYNLKSLDVNIPLRRFIALTGVSGSGKSTLMVDVLHKELANRLNNASHEPGKVGKIMGTEYLSRVVNIDQSPIGRTPRSNPATYTGCWDYIRDLFASTEEARVRGYKKGRFSFNVEGGRCENCKGHGRIKIDMHFLPTVYVECDVCHGRRYNRETLKVKYKGKSIYDVLEMTVEEAREFFEDIPWLDDRLGIMEEVGLEYLKLGQPAPTLSGGEAQRVKLARELGKKSARKTMYLLDEPTTGLHFHDVKKLIDVLQKLVDKGNTVMVIEHNPDVIKSVDWIIDLGPDGGVNGGELVVAGTPETVSKKGYSHTGKYLKKYLE
ncbi:MAG TPA: excinuclease ABC subunit UvrA [Candidatus Paceibacterota bacterium]|nr:excinuclease ABC subunit UvrA [Candidatus Paceibacterota bacterium]